MTSLRQTSLFTLGITPYESPTDSELTPPMISSMTSPMTSSGTPCDPKWLPQVTQTSDSLTWLTTWLVTPYLTPIPYCDSSPDSSCTWHILWHTLDSDYDSPCDSANWLVYWLSKLTHTLLTHSDSLLPLLILLLHSDSHCDSDYDSFIYL